MLPLYLPPSQIAHAASSAILVPGTTPVPVPHDEMLCGVQGLLSVVVENHPVVQSAQLTEADVYAWPAGQGHVSAAQSVLYVVATKTELLFQASAIRRLLHEEMDVARAKV